jgi:hypothetical protein
VEVDEDATAKKMLSVMNNELPFKYEARGHVIPKTEIVYLSPTVIINGLEYN